MTSIFESSSVNINSNNVVDTENNLFNEKKWEWGSLRQKCRDLDLEQFYEAYMQRLRLSYLSLFVFIEALVSTVHSLILLTTVQHLSGVYVDICIYLGSAVLVWIVLLINFRDELIRRHTWIMYVSSWIAVSILVMADLGVPIYHGVASHHILRPTYGSYVLYAIYIVLPLPDNFHAFMLGMVVTASYLINYGFLTYRKQDQGIEHVDTTKLISEAIFLTCINIMGIYFRMMKEIAIRTTFLDRLHGVEENLLLRYARDQEKSLLLSIIPAQIANKIEQDVKGRIEQMKHDNQARAISTSESRKLFIEPHNDVTVLYADVVNYTYLTTTLDVKTLVETLHDLFVKFDTASEEYNVLRIKFLGDCYYCVAGVPIPNENHAKCCVDLGLRMIKDIRDVRAKRNLDIDMRIGVHSGNILSGVIGACKWQFDIWSKDVDIANRLEATGVAGRVHVSEETLKLLDGEYMYEEGTLDARSDRVLRKFRIRTFLIKPPKFLPVYVDYRRPTIGFPRLMENRSKTDISTNFMQNPIVQFNQMRTQAKFEMSHELDKMPIGRIQVSKFCFGRSKRLTQDEMEEQSFRSNITSTCLFFKDWRWEFLFMKEPDVMLKYSVLFGSITFYCITAIQAINEPQSMSFWNINAVNSVMLLFFLVITWYKKLWIMFLADLEFSRPKSKLSLFMYNLSDKIQSIIWARVTIYLLIVVMHCACTLLQLLNCDRFQAENDEIDIQLFHDGERGNLCFNPWAITENIMLAICISFLFTRIPFVLKLGVGCFIISCYAIVVVFEYDFIYEKSPTTNVGLYPEYSHLLVLLITLGIYHMMDRESEYVSKVDYNWKRQLQKKQDDAKVTNESIKILINNILPTHVADIYITKKMKNELYFEEYDNVAVMFATIRNYDTEKVGLRVLNEIICDFDAVLNGYKGPLKIEKIKVAGWTYMAACGLELARSSALMSNGQGSNYYNTGSTRSTRDVGYDSEPSTSAAAASHMSVHSEGQGRGHKSRKISSPQQSNVVYVMAQFALDLMRTMHSFNMENLQCEDGDKDQGMLRIGISNGEIMAGVVGSYKPHYDIWGNAVNMASRMDSTGVPGSIQVTEDTAKVLLAFGIECTYRGLTFVKGCGKIPTYFVGVDKELNFRKAGVNHSVFVPKPSDDTLSSKSDWSENE